MKKAKFIVLALAVSLMLIGAGYAAWTDKITINETASMGNVDVDWFWNNIAPDPNGVWTSDPSTSTNANISQDGKTLTVTLNNLYPGAVVNWNGQLMNNGSLPVKFTGLKVNVTDDQDGIAKYLQVYYDTKLYDKTNWSAYNILGYGEDWSHQNDFISFSKFQSTMNSDAVLAGYVVPANGGRISFGDPNDAQPNCIKLKLAPNAPQTLEGKSITFTLDFNFAQAY